MTLIRRGTLEDCDAVFQLARQFVTETASIDLDGFTVAFNNVIRWRENETNVLHVAENDSGEVIGYTLMSVSRLLHVSGLTAHLQELVVDESARGQGVGSDLVYANELYAMERGVRRLTMSTSRAGEFYRRLGYEVTAEFYKKILPAGG
ncbi:GNAT family N-acetyltransferase [Labedella endophytica]|uniref:N-acetyltransferase n=1 Tax=Labedella endophytica TaxID=1523160 RepID=A0A433JMY2_9MICO|nr:GNAT family N-acetyltransferase [Labedella endophytica]RUQ97117.1 N-acetyltransferase [Labedella endophytica]